MAQGPMKTQTAKSEPDQVGVKEVKFPTQKDSKVRETGLTRDGRAVGGM